MMSREAGYDQVLTVFNPNGRLLQLEYAHRVVEKAQPITGVVYKGGVVVAGIRATHDPLMDIKKFHKVYDLGENLVIAFAGISSDARILIDYVRADIQGYKLTFDEAPRPVDVATRLAKIMHIYTLYASIRPFGVSFLLGGVADNKGELFLLVPGGYSTAYKAWALGRAADSMNSIFEREYKEDISKEDAINLTFRALKEGYGKIKETDIEVAIVDSKEGLKHLEENELKEYLER